MKIKHILFAIVICIGAMGISSCSKDDPKEEVLNSCTDYLDDLQSYLDAMSAYSSNPTVKNCEAYKAAMLNFYEEYKDCAFYSEGNYQDAIDGIKQMDCNQ